MSHVPPARSRAVSIGAPLLALAAGVAGLVGAVSLFGPTDLGAGFRSSLDPAFGVDPLSGFFLLVLAVVAVPVCVFARSYLDGVPRSGALVGLTGLFLLCLVGFLTARDPLTFLAFWELITLVPAAAILVGGSDPHSRRVVFVYLAITHLGGVGTWVAILALADLGALSDPSALLAHGGGTQAIVVAAALVGFGTKAGLMPLHSWLPRAHPVAPAFLSALMSAVMIKLALYGLIRVLFEWAAPVPAWSGYALLALGVLSALGGIVYALFQRRLKTLLAFSSIENAGIAAAALGASILFASAGEELWASLAFAAALLQIAAHAVSKALLFCGAGAFERAVGDLDLDRLGGLLRRMPLTGAAFLIGCMAIAGLPPLGGFAAEWMVLQAMFHLAIEAPLGTGIAATSALLALAATAALALYCFVRVAGQTLLGEPRTERARTAVDPPAGMTLPLLVLAAGTVAIGLLAGAMLPVLVELAPIPVDFEASPALDLPGTGGLPSVWIAVALAVLVAALWKLRGSRRAAPSPAWACGQREIPAMRWTTDGFTKPLRLVLEPALRSRSEVTAIVEGGVVESVGYRGSIPHLFDTALYGPLRRRALAAATHARRLQTGNVRTYAGYLLATVLVALLLLRTGVLG